ncbi:MAG: hypothetical protein A2X34_08315 [Elusimicrobia bacterium GWC2_51_8]|nr:MAG: hypothetical protein A2X33_02485 [Elusimicrobia bacterium GWA2_51_34]OGR59351.1 MAG: hypothetical protein A2X34_08315 [Elusimicrobia bacterium GWC2_51_8]OGR86980.1 MAG: hypothetical protein A2021_01455 [Elusimicrobia bacterium GWF2_52_66]HAF96567.1 hypothetical protein [Elusimicrobiota bacterium]HCE98207.1 hypothetical protein [Elusimicrobiota bacterium]
MNKNQHSVSVVIPAYNEETGLSVLLPQLVEKHDQHGWEIIVVNDGSNDKTREIAEKFAPKIRLINHRVNSGYGASIKSGVRVAHSYWIATFDADLQHQISDLEKLIANSEGHDAVIGMRANMKNSGFWRMPGKIVLRYIFSFITGYKVKDINCGLRIIKRSVMFKIFGLACDRFSFSTSTTIALLNLGYEVNFVEINVQKRVGTSTVRQVSDGMQAILLMLRMVTLFNPFRVFLPIAGVLLVLGISYQVADFFISGITIHKSALLLIVCGLMLFLFALQQDQISSLRREIASFEVNFEDGGENDNEKA